MKIGKSSLKCSKRGFLPNQQGNKSGGKDGPPTLTFGCVGKKRRPQSLRKEEKKRGVGQKEREKGTLLERCVLSRATGVGPSDKGGLKEESLKKEIGIRLEIRH